MGKIMLKGQNEIDGKKLNLDNFTNLPCGIHENVPLR